MKCYICFPKLTTKRQSIKRFDCIKNRINSLGVGADGKKIDFIDTINYGDDPPKTTKYYTLWYLATEIQKMSEADFVAFAPNWETDAECKVINKIVLMYDIPYFELEPWEDYG